VRARREAAAEGPRAAPLISRALLTGALAIVLVCVGTRPAEAQDTGLSKSELVRLVVSTDSPDVKIRTVRTRCLSFEPTEGDWRDLRNLGASEELISAAQQCAREAEAVQVALNASSSSVRAGDTTLVTVDLTRAGTALSGQAVTLTGSGGPGSGTRYDRTTNSRGRAFFSLPGGERTGSTRYTVSASGIDLQGPTRITVTTRADVPARATLEPASIDLSPDEDPPEVAVSVEDRFGNPVGGIELELLGGPEPDAPVLATATTDAGGRAGLTAEQRPTGITTWSVRADGEVLASLPVQGPAPAAAGVAAAAPRNVEPADDAAVRAGDESLAAGDPVAAEQSYRAALGISPRRTDAQKGLAAALLAQGRANEAATWYEVATRGSPTDADAWDGLGQAYAAAGRRDDAAQAFARARELDPSREELATEIAGLGQPPGYATGILWGGSTSGSSGSGGIRRAAVDLSFSPAIAIWGGWDRSLAPNSPELVRGPDEWDGWYAGGGLSYGSGHRLQTAFELGQRTQQFAPIDESSTLKQNVYRLTQTVRFADDRRATELKIGGYMGRWFDRDDWLVFSRLKAPIGQQLSLLASGSYGETIGTNWVETGRHADKDGRFYGGVAWETVSGFLVQPQVGVGSVSSARSDDLSGTLLDLLLEAAVPITRGTQIRGFLRHQSPPGSDSFTTFAIALGFKLGWAGG